MERKKIIWICFAGVFFVLGLAFFGQTFFSEKGKVAGEQTKNLSADIEELKNKIGSGVDYSTSKNTGALTFMAAGKEKIPLPLEKLVSVEPTVAAKYFMQEYGKYFGLAKPAKELLPAGVKKDDRKMSHVSYVQKYEGIPVFGTYGIVHLKGDNSVSSASAKFLPNIVSETHPKIFQNRAKKEAEKYWADWGYSEKPQTAKPELFVFNKGLVENKKSDSFRLVWMVEVFGKEKGGHEYFFINALDGSLVYHLSGTRSLNRNIYDGDSGAYILSRSEGQAATGTADVDNAYGFLFGAHSYFQTNFGRDGANKLGGLGDGSTKPYTDTDAYVRIDNNPEKIFACPNAWYDYYSIKFCSGEMTADVLGHEYGHGVTYHSILYNALPWGFDYEGESGAMDEGYADIFGELIENSVKGSADWRIGEDSTSGVSRSLADPGSLNMGYGLFPGKMSDLGFYCGSEDYGGVHQNSTVFSHGAYLAAVGGAYNGRTVSGVGTAAAGQIFYRALNYYLGASSSFEDAYNALNSSCSDLYGAGSATCSEVQKALQAVELDQASLCEAGTAETSADQPQITSDVSTLAYSTSKKAKRRMNLTVSGISVSKKKYLTVRLSGRKTKVKGARVSGDSTIVNIEIKYRKWPIGSYGAAVYYKQKIGKSWQKGSVSEENVLSII
ncbi:MAG: M4 family metallopeptidase [Candidatus Moranbacteria bacterium]|nr:M4 family metallopeptidase [Candidatus Moranbacteria bacterium]